MENWWQKINLRQWKNQWKIDENIYRKIHGLGWSFRRCDVTLLDSRWTESEDRVKILEPDTRICNKNSILKYLKMIKWLKYLIFSFQLKAGCLTLGIIYLIVDILYIVISAFILSTIYQDLSKTGETSIFTAQTALSFQLFVWFDKYWNWIWDKQTCLLQLKKRGLAMKC